MPKIRGMLFISICSALLACATPWERKDGGEFNQTRYEMDRSICDSEARRLVTGQTIRPFSETRIASQYSGAIVTQFRACMNRKGWKMK